MGASLRLLLMDTPNTKDVQLQGALRPDSPPGALPLDRCCGLHYRTFCIASLLLFAVEEIMIIHQLLVVARLLICVITCIY